MKDYSKLTSQQKLCFANDRHLSVTANAGSGKTFILTERYQSLILNHKEKVLPSEILAITFTKKAAAEMKTRILKNLNKEISSAEASESRENLGFLYDIRQNMSSAKIMTIHSFCNNLLKDYPIEAGLNPNFRELQEAEISELNTYAINTALESFIEKNSLVTKELLTLNYKEKITEIINSLLDDAFKGKKILEYYKRTEEEIFEDIQDSISKKIGELFRNLFALINEILLELDENSHDSIANFSTFFYSFYHNMHNASIDELISNYNDLNILDSKSKILKADLEIKKNIIDINPEISKYNNQLKWFGKEIGQLDREGLEEKNLKKDISFGREISKLYQVAKEIADNEKSALNGITFDDMMILGDKVLESDTVRKHIQNSYKYVMVDEFQDTNDLQYNIVKKLVSDFEYISKDSAKLFIVGDRKQSIYGFRSADVRTFNIAEKEISIINKEKIARKLISNTISLDRNIATIAQSKEESSGIIELKSSFRLLPNLTAFINNVFSNLMNIKKQNIVNINVSDIPYQEMVCGRNIANEVDNLKENENLGTINIILNIKPKKEETSDSAIEDEESQEIGEAKIIAQKVKQIFSENKLKVYQANNSGEESPKEQIDFSDIAILARRKKIFNEISRELSKIGIPNIVHSGSGFYDSQEVKDLISLLRYLYFSEDDLALASILKSPYFCVHEEELFKISQEQGNTFHEKALSLINNNKAGENLIRGINILNKYKSRSGKMPIGLLLQSIIDESLWYGVIKQDKFHEQIIRNVKKFINYARSFESIGNKNLHDFINQLKILAKSSNEGEAAIISNTDAVNIMTIHASKGLQFPIVFLVDTLSSKENSFSNNFSEEYGISLPLKEYNNSTIINELKTFNYWQIKSSEKNKDYEESKRVLYVALTRAKDHLFITANTNENKQGISQGSGLFNMIGNSLGVCEENHFVNYIYEINSKGTGFTSKSYSQKIKFLINAKEVEKDIKYTINYELFYDNEFEDSKLIINTKHNSDNKIEIMPKPMKFDSSDNLFSPTRIMSYKEKNPYEVQNDDTYIKKFILGMNHGLQLNNRSKGLQKVDTKGAVFGTFIHELMEQIELWTDEKLNADIDKLQKIIEQKMFQADNFFTDDFTSKTLQTIKNIINTKFIRSNIQLLIKSEKEVNLNMPVGEDFLTGSLDVLVENENNIEIWDWKTNNISTESQLIEKSNYYEFQMKLYAYLLISMKDEYTSVTCRLMFTSMALEGCDDNRWIKTYEFDKTTLQNFGNELLAEIPQMKFF